MDQLITDSGVSLDLKEGVPIPLNMSIADFREPEKRQRNFSKEIDMPGTAKNQQFFASAFQLTKIGGTYDFNSSAKVNCKYYKNQNLIFPSAVLKLNKVVILDGVITFKVGMFSDFVDIFLILSNKDVRELDWSAYNHTLTNAHIIATWSTGMGTGYYYPLIEKNQRATISSWKNTEMIPYVYLVDVFDKCMSLVGQKYSSAFLATTRAKKILFGYGGGNYIDNTISPVEQNNRKVILNNGVINQSETRMIVDDGSGLPQVHGVVVFNTLYLCDLMYLLSGPVIPLTFTEVQDINNQNVVSTFTAGRTGNYRITIQGSMRFNYTGSFTYVQGGTRQFWYAKNGVYAPPLSVFVQTSADQTFAFNQSFNVQLNQGDTIKYYLQAPSSGIQFTLGDVGTLITETITTPTPLQVTYECTDTTLVEGSIVEVGRFLPSMKCSEFVLGFLRQFKLMVSDPDIYGVVTIEPEVNFYQGTNVFTDITEEVEHKKEIEIRPSANEYAKKLSYKFKAGTETDSKNYLAKWLESYGDLSFNQPSFFAKGEQKIELPWATVIPYQLYPNVIAPRFVDIDNAGIKKTTSGVARIMFRNPMRNGAWQLKGSATNNLTQYPCVHHFDDIANPAFDLNFKLVGELYYAATIVTTINTFSEYYHTGVQQIISPEGKYIQLYRKMNSLKVQQLDWSRLLMWNGSLFIFNKIVDFDSEITEITKIELIKVIEARSKNTGSTSLTSSLFKPTVAIVMGPSIDSIGIDTHKVLAGTNSAHASSDLIIG